MEENRDAIRIYMLCQDQLIMAPMGGPIAIDYKAVQFTMDLFKVADRRQCFEKVIYLAREFIARDNKGMSG